MPKRKTRSSTTAESHDDKTHDAEPVPSHEEETSQPQSASTEAPQRDQVVHHYTIPLEDSKQITCERRSPEQNHTSPPALIFTHGAGGGITAPSTSDFAHGFSSRAPIVCYAGTMNLKNRIKYFRTVIAHSKAGQAALGGRSMGARAAVLTALDRYSDEEIPASEKAKALVLVSYPLLAGSTGEKREPERREKILTDLPEGVNVLFVVGDADAQCPLDMLEETREGMVARSWLCVVEGADHGMGMKPKSASEAMRTKTGELAAAWLQERDREARYSSIRWDDGRDAIVHDVWRTSRAAG